ncbi:hypothetical protein RXV86_08940 [Alisedimentitalea sp. MJ-SS2]|uniref:hypothetical protein n=1 Tax=Aliisedimentitalea sp. MJ-SS2 TaxID=3049795 RepID=UPI0029062CA8|nr:hypothetical protein [Alisedimentitalea sp. MJ-SS2]MDU8927507.1 hypothetical protein [Alisedimentitalea sp. MJ-SS2]
MQNCSSCGEQTISIQMRLKIVSGNGTECVSCGKVMEFPAWADFLIGMYQGVMPTMIAGLFLVLLLIGKYFGALLVVLVPTLVFVILVSSLPIRQDHPHDQ